MWGVAPVSLFHSGDSHIEGGATRIQDVTSSCQEDACAVDSKWVALTHITLQAVEGTVLGDLQESSHLHYCTVIGMSRITIEANPCFES